MVRYRCRYESRLLSSLFTLAADLVMHQRRVWVLPNFLSHVTQWRMTLLFHIGGIHLEASRTQTGPLCSLVAGLRSHVFLLVGFPQLGEWYNLRKWLHSNLNTHTRCYSTYQCVIRDRINTLNPRGACSMPDRKSTVDLSPDWFTHDPTNWAEGKSVVSTMWCWIKGFDRENRLYQKI